MNELSREQVERMIEDKVHPILAKLEAAYDEMARFQKDIATESMCRDEAMGSASLTAPILNKKIKRLVVKIDELKAVVERQAGELSTLSNGDWAMTHRLDILARKLKELKEGNGQTQ